MSVLPCYGIFLSGKDRRFLALCPLIETTKSKSEAFLTTSVTSYPVIHRAIKTGDRAEKHRSVAKEMQHKKTASDFSLMPFNLPDE